MAASGHVWGQLVGEVEVVSIVLVLTCMVLCLERCGVTETKGHWGGHQATGGALCGRLGDCGMKLGDTPLVL